MNDAEFVTGIKNMLKEATNNCAKSIAEYNSLNDEIKSGKYAPDYIRSLTDKAVAARHKFESIMNGVKQNAYKFVEDYAMEIRNRDRLDSSQLTDDIKLLNCGVALNKEDLLGLLDKNKDNLTMTQIILRYAKEHNIDVGSPVVYMSGNREQADKVDRFKTVVDYYMKYIDKPNALDMLDKFIET